MLVSSQPHQPNPMLQVLSHRDFRLLWIGQITSLLGDQFYLVAAPWLVLKLTGDPLALGTVLALGAIPRAIVMLVGGAITDRFSPRRIMLLSDLVRLILVLGMLTLVLTNQIQVWMLYAFSFLFGLISGFFLPASSSIVPHLLPGRELQAGNSIFQGSSQLVMFVGPALAGVVIGTASGNKTGLAAAFAIDALTFVVSITTLWLIHGSDTTRARQVAESVWQSIRAGLGFAWSDGFLRLLFIIIAFANLLFSGPLMVGIPVLSNQRLPGGAMAYGLILSAYAGGNLLGIILCGALPKPSARWMKIFLFCLLFLFGVALILLSQITAVWMGFVLLFILGVANGYYHITLLTGLQLYAPKLMLGRMMSLVMLANVGLMPVSQALSGFLCRWNLNALFILSGVGMLVLGIWLALQPELDRASHVLSETSAQAAQP
jgi:MFS family permease